jgi:hypothetical protein
MVLFVRVSVDVRATKVSVPVGNVKSDVPVVFKVSVLASVPNETVFPLGIVKVPVVLVTMSPFTLSALKAYAEEDSWILEVNVSPSNVISRYIESELKSMSDEANVVTDPIFALKIPFVTVRFWLSDHAGDPSWVPELAAS